MDHAAYSLHPEAAVTLAAMETVLPTFFRAMGGDPALKLKAGGSRAAQHGVQLAWRDHDHLHLPEAIGLFAQRHCNRELYFWLAALAAEELPEGDWLNSNRLAAAACLARMPGLAAVYQGLVAHLLALRPDPQDLPEPQASGERAIRQALQHPEQPVSMPDGADGLLAVPLWLNPNPPHAGTKPQQPRPSSEQLAQSASPAGGDKAKPGDKSLGGKKKNVVLQEFRFKGEDRWDQYLNDNRPGGSGGEGGQGGEDHGMRPTVLEGDNAPPATSGMTYGFILPAGDDDIPLGPGIKVPEWDFRKQQLRHDYCLIKPMLPAGSHPQVLPERLRQLGRHIQRQFQALTPERHRYNGEPTGPDIDLDRVIRFFVERHSGHAIGEPGLYQAWPPRERSLACLLLADLSLSTENRLDNGSRIIDVIRDGLLLFAEALTCCGDRFGLYGFSSLQREEVRFLLLKDFAERYDKETRGRILALRPGYYTRMGPAIRQATRILQQQPAHKRLLLLVSDGKPSDLDHYDGRYAVEDTREAVREARSAGITPFCVTVDKEGSAYLPHIFGNRGYVVLQHAETLPQVLTKLYAQLTR